MNKPQIITDDVATNYDYMRQDAGEILGSKDAIADRLFKNDKIYQGYKGDWSRTDTSGGGFTEVTTGRKDGKFFITRKQLNTDAVKAGARRYREMAEAGIPDPLAPMGPDGKLQYSWMSLPKVISIRISDQYFGGLPWEVIKQDTTTKAQFYQVVQREYPEYITYPGGRLPIPVSAPYPARTGETKYFKGM